MKNTILFLFATMLISFSLSAQPLKATAGEDEVRFRSYLDAGHPEAIEGIYKTMTGAYYRVGIKKVAENKYIATVLELDPKLKKRWKTGDVKAHLERSAVPYLYSVRWIYNDKTERETTATFENQSILRLDDGLESIKYLKIYPAAVAN